MKTPTLFSEWKKLKSTLIIDIAHGHECRLRDSNTPLNECSCDCYEFALFRAGYIAARITTIRDKHG